MEAFRARLITNSIIATFILLAPVISGFPITWWNVAGFAVILVFTFATRKWYAKNRSGILDTEEEKPPEE